MKIRRDVFQAISDPSRRRIALLLASESLTAGGIAENFSTTRSAISRHLKVLVECELVSQTHKGREILYSVNPEKMKTVAEFIWQFKDSWNSKGEPFLKWK